jgi:hypothetical protein
MSSDPQPPDGACQVPGCGRPTHPRMLACKTHWQRVPVHRRNDVWLAVFGTDAWLSAARVALDAAGAAGES